MHSKIFGIFRKIQLPWLIVLIMLLAFVLREYNADHINNDIKDLYARQTIMAMDSMHGIYHFPNGPWLFEYDESGFAWLLIPFITVFGHQWIMFRTLTAVITSLVPGFLALFCIRLWNRRTGLAAALLFMTLPAQMTWDRNLVMASLAITTMVWFYLIYTLFKSDWKVNRTFFFSGVILGISCYIVHYNSMILATLSLVIALKAIRQRRRITEFLTRFFLLVGGWMLISLPNLIHKYRHPEYMDWRKRHFVEYTGDIGHYVSVYLSNLKTQFFELFFGGGKFLFLHDDLPVFSIVFSILILLGLIYLIWKDRSKLVLVFAMPIVLFFLSGTTKPEDFRGVFDFHYVPFFAISAALGLRFSGQLASRFLPKKLINGFACLLVMILVIFHLWQFFNGPYRIFPRPDYMTRLQKDMMVADPIPYIFSSRIHEVDHYHYPFWFVTRVDHPEVSIFNWDEKGFLSEPDKQAITFTKNRDSRVGIVIREQDLQEFINAIGKDKILSWRKQPYSGLYIVKCKVEVPDLLKRTWTKSLVPPIIDKNKTRIKSASKNES